MFTDEDEIFYRGETIKKGTPEFEKVLLDYVKEQSFDLGINSLREVKNPKDLMFDIHKLLNGSPENKSEFPKLTKFEKEMTKDPYFSKLARDIF